MAGVSEEDLVAEIERIAGLRGAALAAGE